MQLLPNNTWEQVEIKNGEIPGCMSVHQFLTHLDNLYNIGGHVNGIPTKKCFVFNIKSSEVEPIVSLENATSLHTLHHANGMSKAYVCGGITTDWIYLKDILEFDISNQKFKTFGLLNTARYNAGVITCQKYLWVFGG